MVLRTVCALGFFLLLTAAEPATDLRKYFRRNKEDKVIGGGPLSEPESYMVSLRDGYDNHFCGGTLISNLVVLTAAHCIQSLNPIQVHIGRLRRQDPDTVTYERINTVKTVIHPQYNQGFRWNNDVALLFLASESSNEPIDLASSDPCFEAVGGCQVRLLGWGAKEDGAASDVLEEAFTRSVDRATCQREWGAWLVSSAMICAGGNSGGGQNTCPGDSGGPMIQDGVQVGIVSWGDGCGPSGMPGVYASVPDIIPWIQQEIQRVNSDCECTANGWSGGVYTGRVGCAQHLLSQGNPTTFCMVTGGGSCPHASPSGAFPGAAWKICSIPVDPCECTLDGFSGGVFTGRIGCAQHLIFEGTYTWFCMVRDGSQCTTASPSGAYPGAYWRVCP